MMNTPLFVEEDTNTTLVVVCPVCNQEVRTQGNAIRVWIMAHDSAEGKCPASNREVRRIPRQP